MVGTKYLVGNTVNYRGGSVKVLEILDAWRPGLYTEFTSSGPGQYNYLIEVLTPGPGFEKGQELQVPGITLESLGILN